MYVEMLNINFCCVLASVQSEIGGQAISIEAGILSFVENAPGERKRLAMTKVGGARARWRVVDARFSGRAPMRGSL